MKMIPRWLGIVLAIAIVAGLVYALQPQPELVEVGQVERRAFAETVEEQGRTRAHRPFVVTAPIAGRLLRTALDEGDQVTEGQVIARIAPSPQDQRTAAYAEANLTSVQARYAATEAALQEAQSTLARNRRELERREQLFAQDLASAEEVENFRQLVETGESRVEAANANLRAAGAEIESARAFLIGVSNVDHEEPQIVDVRSPSDGTVYRVFEENERVIQAGEPIFSISNNDRMELVVDLLTQDAMRVEPGDSVRITGWGGDYTIDAVVLYIEPEAFTKVSALGVEEQRVNVIAELLNVPDNMGAEYRVEVAIVTWQDQDVLTIPTSAIFQRSDGWNTFVVVDGRTELRPLFIGVRGRDFTQVIDGVSEDDTVVVFPSDLINEGTRVTF
ncbi:MAG: HlyD family efflux transporter periplasmic adaptor subunit [Gammaproteobacteria bacterium]|nr:HlyD family efflux transporter periplasmic adaptor subunit [Gammaproteobacteria bacterium]